MDVMKHSGLRFLKIVSSFEQKIPKDWSQCLKGISLEAGVELGAKDWIHGSEYIESWDTYSSQPEQLRR